MSSHLNPDGTVNLDEPSEPDDELAHLDPAAIANCTLCDTDGYRNLVVCDHIDHTAETPGPRSIPRRDGEAPSPTSRKGKCLPVALGFIHLDPWPGDARVTAIALLAAELRDEYGLEKAGEYLALMFEAVDARKETSENPHVGWDDPDDCGTDDLDEFIARDVDRHRVRAMVHQPQETRKGLTETVVLLCQRCGRPFQTDVIRALCGACQRAQEVAS